ncbi:hypothetical protein, partial [Streptomyces rochei]|uniref:hypothetical protein n=1 Tax=Streptomyces rochei TaxID=1928 RepID=UPI00194249A3
MFATVLGIFARPAGPDPPSGLAFVTLPPFCCSATFRLSEFCAAVIVRRMRSGCPRAWRVTPSAQESVGPRFRARRGPAGARSRP